MLQELFAIKRVVISLKREVRNALKSPSQVIKMAIKSDPLLRFWKNPGPDCGWSWVILVCNFFFLGICYGICTTGSTGILFLEFASVFGISRQNAAWPFSVIGIVQCVVGLTSGVVNRLFDLRYVILFSASCCSLALILCFWATNIIWVIFFFGILYGCGSALYMTSSLLFINQYFKKYVSTVNGIFMVSSPVAGIILPYFVNALVNLYGLRGAMLLTGGLAMQLLVLGFLMRPRTSKHFPCLDDSYGKQEKLLPPTEETNKQKNEEKSSQESTFLKTLSSYKEVVFDPMFYVVTVQAVVTLNALVGISLTLTDFAMDNRLTRENGILLLAIFAVADIVGRLSVGWLAGQGWVKRARLSMMSMFFLGSSLFLYSARTEIAWLAVISVAAGVFEGGQATTANVHYYHYFEKLNLPAALGLRLFCNGIVAFFRPLLAGFFRDRYMSYTPFYYLLGSLSLFSAFLWSLEPWLMRRKKRRMCQSDVLSVGNMDCLQVEIKPSA